MRMVARVLAGLFWAGLLYVMAYQLVFVAAATWAGVREPQKYPAVCDEAFATAMQTLNPYLVAGTLALAAAGAWTRLLPGTGGSGRSPKPLNQTPKQRVIERLSFRLALSSVIAMASLATLNHILRPDYDPMSRHLSEYAVGSYWAIGTATLAAGATIFLSFGIGLAVSVTRSFWLVMASGCFITSALALYVCVAFPTDLLGPGGAMPTNSTVHGILHNTFAALLALAAVEGFLFLPGAFFQCSRWRPMFSTSVIATVLLLAVFLIVPWLPPSFTAMGIKIWYALMAGWIACVAICSGAPRKLDGVSIH
jgi:hypothetical protein